MSENRRNSVFKKHIEKMLLQILFICDNKIAPRQTDSCPSFVFYQFNLRTHSVLGTEFRTEFGWSKVNFGKRTKRILCLCPNKSFPKAKRFQKSKCLTPSQSFATMCGLLISQLFFSMTVSCPAVWMEACVLSLKRQKRLRVSTTVSGVRVLMADHAEILLKVTSAAALQVNLPANNVNKVRIPLFEERIAIYN